MNGSLYEVGKTADLVVHVHGEVTAMTGDQITIAGHALPRQLGNGVVTLSTEWPRPEIVRVDSDDCEGACGYTDDRQVVETVEDVVDAARRAHDEAHDPNWAYCEDAICAAVRLAS